MPHLTCHFSYTCCDVKVKSPNQEQIHVFGHCRKVVQQYSDSTSGPALYVKINAQQFKLNGIVPTHTVYFASHNLLIPTSVLSALVTLLYDTRGLNITSVVQLRTGRGRKTRERPTSLNKKLIRMH